MRRRPSVTEASIASVVVDHFEAIGADVYQEVACSGGVADIVALVGAELWIIEVKTSFSLALIAQAMDRTRLAHRVYISAPMSRNLREVETVCRELGIGVLTIGTVTDYDDNRRWSVVEELRSRRWNTRPVALRSKLAPEHKTHAKAGAAGAAGRWTPFRDTCEQLARIVRAQPGITMREAVAKIRHHYATAAGARSSLAHWIGHKKVDGVRLESRGGRIHLYPRHSSTEDIEALSATERAHLERIHTSPAARCVAFCWRCGHPVGSDAAAEIDREAPKDDFDAIEVRHLDREWCARNVAATEGRQVQ